MATALRKTGISIVGDMPWGTHFCHFHETKEDLLDTFFAPLSPTALAFLQQSLAYQQHRRRVYRARRLQVYLDGEER